MICRMSPMMPSTNRNARRHAPAMSSRRWCHHTSFPCRITRCNHALSAVFHASGRHIVLPALTRSDATQYYAARNSGGHASEETTPVPCHERQPNTPPATYVTESHACFKRQRRRRTPEPYTTQPPCLPPATRRIAEQELACHQPRRHHVARMLRRAWRRTGADVTLPRSPVAYA